MTATPNQAKSRFVSSIETRNAAPVIAAQTRPKKPASSSASGNRAVATAREGQEQRVEEHREQHGRGGHRHEQVRLRRTYPKPSPMSLNADRGRALRVGRPGARPSTRTHSTEASPRHPAQTSSRFSAPTIAASGRVASPPTTDPRIPPAPKIGNRRLACWVSTTVPAAPHSPIACASVANATVIQIAG